MKTMEIERFEALAEAYGGEIGRWPAEFQDPARALLRSAPEAERLLRAAAADDELFGTFAPPQPSFALREALIAAAPRPGRAPALDWRRLFLPGAGLAAAGLAGVVVGAVVCMEAIQAAQTDAAVDSALIVDSGAAIVDDGGLSLTIPRAGPSRRA